MNRNLTATVLIVLAIGIYFTVTEGMISKAKEVQAINNQYASAIKNAVTLIQLRDKVQNDWKNLSQDEQDRLDRMVPKSVDNIRLVIDLNSIALKHGFSLKGIKASAAENPGTVSAPASPGVPGGASTVIKAPILDDVTVGFTVSAPYGQFINFLQDIESNLRIMDVTQLSMGSTDNGIYNWTVELKTYWLRQQ
jgi:Tfp pilus assembly protein PilO